MSKKSFEELLKDKTREYSPVPREGMWQNIEAALPPEKKKRRGMILFLSSGLTVAAVVFLIWFFLPNHSYYQNALVQPELLDIKEEKNNSKPLPLEKEQELSIEQNQNNPQALALDKTPNTVAAKPKTYRHKPEQNLAIHAKEDGVNHFTHNPSDTELPLPDKTSNQTNGIELIHEPDAELISEKSDNDSFLMIDETKSDETPKLVEKIDSVPDISQTIDPSLSSVAKPKKNLFVGLMFSPGISNSRITLDQDYRGREPYESTYNNRKNLDKSRYAFSAGVYAGYRKNNHHLGMGLFFQKVEYQMPVVNINSAILRGTGSGIINFDFNATDSFKVQSPSEGGSYISNRFQFISIPIMYSISLYNRSHFSIGLSTQASFNFLWSHKGLLSQNESGFYVKQTSALENHIQKSHISMAIGPRISYHLSQINCSVFLQPNYAWSLTELEKGQLRTGYNIWSVGSGIQFFIR